MNLTRIVTVNILYRLPDFNHLIQQFVWQTEDTLPELPKVTRFIDYWDEHIEGAMVECQTFVSDFPTEAHVIDHYFEIGTVH